MLRRAYFPLLQNCVIARRSLPVLLRDVDNFLAANTFAQREAGLATIFRTFSAMRTVIADYARRNNHAQ